MSARLQTSGGWSDKLPYGSDTQGSGFPSYGSGDGKLDPFVGVEHVPTLPDGSPDPSVNNPYNDAATEHCSDPALNDFQRGLCVIGLDPVAGLGGVFGNVFGNPIGSISRGVGEVTGIKLDSWLVKGVLLGAAVILVVMGLWALLKNGPVGQGVREGIAEARG